MTRTPASTWAVVAREAGHGKYWRTLSQGNEGDTLNIYRANVTRYAVEGGMRLLDAEGRVVRFTGPMGKPGEERP